MSGRVVTAGGEPAPGTEVRIQDLSRRATTDEEGTFAFLDLPQGSFIIEAESPRFGRAVERVEIRAGGISTLTLVMDPLYQLDELVVSAGPLSARRSETYRPSSSLSGLDLAKAAESSLGETLKGELGVTSTYNGPGASRPLIRGFGGDRVRVLEGGVGLEPLAAERIEVVRSPATLLYGSSAVGGVVNVLDKKIPRETPAPPWKEV